MEEFEHCPGCGAKVPITDGLTHAYIGASAGCWAVFGEVLAKDYNNSRYYKVHRLMVDTYAVQHPGVPSRQSIQSVGVHLIRLHLFLERELSEEIANNAMLRAARHKAKFTWLDPPTVEAHLTIIDIHSAKNPGEHCELVRSWAKEVWNSWSAHHSIIREWAGAGVPGQPEASSQAP